MATRFYVTAQLRIAAPSRSEVRAIITQFNSQIGNGITIPINFKQNGASLNTVTKQLQTVKNTAEHTADSMEKFGKQSALAIRRYTAFAVATGSFLKLGNAIQSSLSDAIEFDKQMVKLRQVTGYSAKDIKTFSNTITDLSTSLGVSSKKLSDVSLVLAQAGLTGKETEKALKTLAKTELSATFEDISNTAEGSIAILNQFGNGVDNLEKDLSSLNTVSAKFAVESSDLVTAVRRAGGAFKASGGSLNEFIALFTSVRQTTRESAESIATGFRTIFTRLQRVRTVNFLENLGIQLRDLKGQFVGPYEAIRKLSAALKEIPSTDPRFAQIIEELGGFRQVSKVIPLIQQFAISEKALSVALRSTNSLSEDAAIAQESLSNKITKVKEEFAALIRELSQNTVLKDIILLGLDLASTFLKVADSLQGVLPLFALLATKKFAGGAASFSRGFTSEIGTTRRFAGGGVVPGSGNSDTVPAMLTPGEFVMRKSAVERIGVGKLHNMNKYASGGMVKHFNTGGTMTKAEALAILESNSISPQAAIKYIKENNKNTIYSKDELNNEIVKLVQNQAALSQLNKAAQAKQEAKVNSTKGITNDIRITDDIAGFFFDVNKQKPGVLDSFINFSSLSEDTKTSLRKKFNLSDTDNPKIYSKVVPHYINPQAKDKFEEISKNAFVHSIEELSTGFRKLFNQPPNSPLNSKQKDDLFNNAGRGLLGTMFEGLVSAYSRNIRASDDTADLDYININKSSFEGLFNNVNEKFGDAKITQSADSITSIRAKVANALAKGIDIKYKKGDEQKTLFASGGSVPGSGNTDSVPSLLTPGEFVINKGAAQRIGYANLHRMNKYNKGGTVQKFGTGGTAFGGIVGLGAISLVINQFGSMNKELDSVISSMQTAVANFAIFNTLLKEFTGVTKLENELNGLADSISSKKAEIESNEAARRHNQQVGLGAHRDLIDIQDRIRNTPLTQTVNQDLLDEEARLKQVIQETAKNATEFKETSTKLKDELKNQLDSQKQYNKFLKFVEVLTGGLALLNTAFISAANYYERKAKSSLAEGQYDDFRNQTVNAGRLSGASSGGSVGGAIGGLAGTALSSFIPIPGLSQIAGQALGSAAGTAAGSLIGGGIGLVLGGNSGEKTANEEIQKAKFAKDADRIDKLLSSLSADKISANTISNDLQKFISKTRTDFATSSPEVRQSIRGRVENQIVGVETFLVKLAESAKTLEEFKRGAGSAYSFFSEFGNQTIPELDKRFNSLIETTQKQNALSQKAIDEERANFARLKDISFLASAFKSLGDSAKETASAIDRLGGGNLSGSLEDFSSVFAGGNVDVNKFNRASIGVGSLFGSSGQDLVQTVQSINNLETVLPQKLIEYTKRGGDSFKSKEDFLDSIDLPKYLKDQLSSTFNDLTENGSEDKLITDIKNNPNKVAEKFIEALDKFKEPFKEAAPVIAQYINNYSKTLDARRKLEDEYNQGLDKVIALRLQGEQALLTGSTERFNPRKNIDLRNSSVQRDIIEAGGFNNLNAQNIITRINRINELNKQQNSLPEIQQGKSILETQQELEDKKNAEIKAVDASRKALEKLANVTEDLTDLQELLSRAGEARQFKKGVAETVTFGTPDDKRQLSNTIFRAQNLAQGKFGRGFENPEVLSFLKNIGEVRLGLFGGKSGTEIEKQAEAAKLGSYGLTKKEIDAILNRTPEELKIQQEIRDRTAQAVEAQQNLNELAKAQSDALSKIANTNHTDLINKLESIRATFEQKQKDDAETEKKLKLAPIDTQINSINDLKKATGGFDLGTKSKQDILRNNIGDFEKLSSLGTKSRSITGKGFQTLDSLKIGENSPEGIQQALDNFSGIINPQKLTQIRQSINSNDGQGFPLSPQELTSQIQPLIRGALNEELTSVIKDSQELHSTLEKEFGNNTQTILQNLEKIKTAFQNLGESIDLSKLQTQRKTIEDHKASGGMVYGRGTSTSDSIPTMLSRGEYIVKAASVSKFGKGFFDSLNNGRVPHMAGGGFMSGNMFDTEVGSIVNKPQEVELNKLRAANAESEKIQSKFYQDMAELQLKRQIKANAKTLLAKQKPGQLSKDALYAQVDLMPDGEKRDRRLESLNNSYKKPTQILSPYTSAADNPQYKAYLTQRNSSLALGNKPRNMREFIQDTNLAKRNAGVAPVADKKSESNNNAQSMNGFIQASDKLSQALSGFTGTITFAGSVKIEVIFNGAETLSSLTPSIAKIAMDETNKALSKYATANGLPSMGIGQDGKPSQKQEGKK